jgi:hypothetical protein
MKDSTHFFHQKGGSRRKTKADRKKNQITLGLQSSKKAGTASLYWKLRLWEFSARHCNEQFMEALAKVAGTTTVEERAWKTAMEELTYMD